MVTANHTLTASLKDCHLHSCPSELDIFKYANSRMSQSMQLLFLCACVHRHIYLFFLFFSWS